MNFKKALIAGYICLDIYPDLASPRAKISKYDSSIGRPILIAASSFKAGGLVPDVGLALDNLGVPVSLVGKLGNDSFGDAVKGLIKKKAPHLI